MKVGRISDQLVLPGEKIAEGDYIVEYGALIRDKRVYATVMGFPVIEEKGKVKVIRVLPIKAPYIPREGDIVIGKIIDVGVSSWSVDINSPYTALLPISEVFSRPVDVTKVDLSKNLAVGDVIVARVISFDLTRDPILTVKESKLGKAPRGFMLELTRHDFYILQKNEEKVQKIGKKYDCNIIIGKNNRLIVIGKSVESEREVIRELLKIVRQHEVRK